MIGATLMSSSPRTVWFAFFGVIFSFAGLPVARTQTPSATSQAPQTPQSDTSQNTPKQDAKAGNNESSRTTPTTLKLRVNVVLVRVVVRDFNGKVITNLKKEDFQLTDNRKTQTISSFSVETPGSHMPTVKMDSAETATEGTLVKAAELPRGFVTLFFDDLHLSTSDAMLSRLAATKLFGAMQPGDRLAIFTTSGKVRQEFTADRGKLDDALQQIIPHSLSVSSAADCPPMTFYEAYQIVEANDPSALQIATDDAAACTGGAQDPRRLALNAAHRELTTGESEIQFSFRNLEALVRRMSALPGPRIIVLMSPGFFVTPYMHESGAIIDRATKANVVINAIDARGLYVSSIYDVSRNSAGINPATAAARTTLITTEEMIQDQILAELADDTGGTFFHNRNDIDKGLLQAATEPEASYVLGFAPQNLKQDGKYHHLKVTLANKQKWALQARHGYFAPYGDSDPQAKAKEEMQQAIFSQQEMHDMPLECQTQFFKIANGVRLTVATHLGIKELKFRRAHDRNNDKLMFSTVIFDENGNLLTVQEEIMDLQLKDETLDRVNKTGIDAEFAFDLQPGTFLIRIVVRDSEGMQMAAINRGVVIP
jgi:VWFA-related protein